MSIITISHDSYSQGKVIAEGVADRFGYDCIDSEQILETCEAYDVSKKVLTRALYKSPGVLSRILPKKESHVSVFRAVFYEHMLRNNIVYHGLAGHIFLSGVPGVFKVRVVADIDHRVREMVRRDGISEKQALEQLERLDAERRKWTKYLYGMDNHDPRLYDIYINLHDMGIEKAVKIIIEAASVSSNGFMPVMMEKLRDLALEAKVEARLLEIFPEVEVRVKDGEVFARINASLIQEEMVARRAESVIADVEGIKAIRVGVRPSIFVPY